MVVICSRCLQGGFDVVIVYLDCVIAASIMVEDNGWGEEEEYGCFRNKEKDV